jgi:hypothetical protein
MAKEEFRVTIREIVKDCILKINASGIYTMKYALKCPLGEIKCCERAFYLSYGVTWHMMKTLRKVSSASLCIYTIVVYIHSISRIIYSISHPI